MTSRLALAEPGFAEKFEWPFQ